MNNWKGWVEVMVAMYSQWVSGWRRLVAAPAGLLGLILSCAFVNGASPVINGFSPLFGGPGTSVTITGSGFDNVREVRFGQSIAIATRVSSAEIRATVPLDAMTGPISVTTTSTATSSLSFHVAPRIGDFAPMQAAPGSTVIINGANFIPGGTTLSFGGRQVSNPSVVGATQVHAVVPSGALSGKIQVATFAGTGLSDQNFIVTGTEPVIGGFSPTNGVAGTVVVVEGQYFTTNATVSFGGVQAAQVSVVGASQLHATVPLGAVTGRIRITTVAGTGVSSSDFVVSGAPHVEEFRPLFGLPGTEVTIEGRNFLNATAVKFNGVASEYTVLGATQIRAKVPVGATDGKITVTTGAGTGASAADFAVTAAPRLHDFSPQSGRVGSVVTINGENLGSTTKVKFGTKEATKFTAVSPTQISVTVPASAETGAISVETPYGMATFRAVFRVITGEPMISEISPRHGLAGTQVVITGENLSGVEDVKFNGVEATFSSTADTQLTCVVPEHALSGPIMVVTTGGTALSPMPFIATPHLTSFTPDEGTSGTEVIVRGTNFTEVSFVRFNGVPAPFAVDSANQIRATVPLEAVSGSISVTTPAGIVGSTNFFSVLPLIVEFTPRGGLAGTVVTIRGSGFAGVNLVQFGGIGASFTYIGPTEIMAVVPEGAATGPIVVRTGNGIAVSADSFVVAQTADLSLGVIESVDPVLLGAEIGYAFTVTNRGPYEAGRVIMTNTMAAGLVYLRGEVTGGTISRSGSNVLVDVGTLPVGQGVSGQLRFLVGGDAPENLEASFRVGSSLLDPVPGDNLVIVNTSVLNVGNVLRIEKAIDKVVLSWPLTGTNFVLEAQGSLRGANTWFPVNAPIQVEGDRHVVNILSTNQAAYFRLKRP